MSFSFEINVDKPNKILFNKITGFLASLPDYLKWEQAFTKAWQEHFGDAKIKIFSDQRGYKPAVPEVIARVTQLRQQAKPYIIATATVVDDGMGKLQMRRLSREAGFQDIEEFFTDYEEALQWLKEQ